MPTKTQEKELSRWEKALAVACPRCDAPEGQKCTLVYFKHLEPQPVERARYEMRSHHRERHLKVVGAL